jgi:hypothetical protein
MQLSSVHISIPAIYPVCQLIGRVHFLKLRHATFFQSYVNKEDIAVFHTGSHAEFHDPFLQRLLSKYVKKISPQHDTSYLDIMNNDAKFTDTVHKYKNVFTHYLASKMEIWMNHFMQPVYGMTDSNTSMKFTKTCGAIHYHMASYSNRPSIAAMHDHLRICAENIADAIKKPSTNS